MAVNMETLKTNFKNLVDTDFISILNKITELRAEIVKLNSQLQSGNVDNINKIKEHEDKIKELTASNNEIAAKLTQCDSDLNFFKSQNDKISKALEAIGKLNADGKRRSKRTKRTKRSKRTKRTKRSKRSSKY